jgi:hypothetical protein
MQIVREPYGFVHADAGPQRDVHGEPTNLDNRGF